MRRVVIDIQNSLFADAIARVLREFASDFDVCLGGGPDKAEELCELTAARRARM